MNDSYACLGEIAWLLSHLVLYVLNMFGILVLYSFSLLRFLFSIRFVLLLGTDGVRFLRIDLLVNFEIRHFFLLILELFYLALFFDSLHFTPFFKGIVGSISLFDFSLKDFLLLLQLFLLVDVQFSREEVVDVFNSTTVCHALVLPFLEYSVENVAWLPTDRIGQSFVF